MYAWLQAIEIRKSEDNEKKDHGVHSQLEYNCTNAQALKLVELVPARYAQFRISCHNLAYLI